LSAVGRQPNGTTDALLLAQGFSLALMVGFVRRGLVTAQPERRFAAGKPVESTRMRITDAAGRRWPKKKAPRERSQV
jgi:hypothetical protein